jgi:Protein of unknown function (DUF3348)
MQPELPRTGLNGSALVELLAELALADRPAAPPSLVEGLGRWLGWQEAINLSAALQAPPIAGAGSSSRGANSANSANSAGSAAALLALDAAFTRVRTVLHATIDKALDEAMNEAGPGPLPGSGSPHFLPWRQCYFSLQQAMEAAVQTLRAQARVALQQLGTQHPGLATLATLDAALADTLAPHEQAQLAVMPVLLDKHHRRQAAAPAAFRHDMQRLLQAELELRLQPALGLLEALRATHTGSE